MSSDQLHPQAQTWERGISLEPSEPRIHDMLLRGYREMLEAARYLGNEAECATIRERLAELGEGAS